MAQCDFPLARKSNLRARSKKVKARILWEKQNGICAICGKKMKPWGTQYNDKKLHFAAATIDHIVPLCLGGSDWDENLQLVHYACNGKKGASQC